MDNILVSALARFNNLSIYNLFPDFLTILLTLYDLCRDVQLQLE
jgi:hypothetical protein